MAYKCKLYEILVCDIVRRSHLVTCPGSIQKVTRLGKPVYAAIYSLHCLPALSTACACVDCVTVKHIINMRFFIIFTAVFAMAQARPGLFFAQPYQTLGVEYVSPGVAAVHPHPAVELNAASEAQLPRGLLKSRDFYDNPHIAAGLAKESWFTNKEMQVVEREAEKIPRESIYHIVKNAGFLDRH